MRVAIGEEPSEITEDQGQTGRLRRGTAGTRFFRSQSPRPQAAPTRGRADRPFSSTRGARYSSRIGSSFIRSVLKYFLLSSGNTVTTTTASPNISCTLTAARKLHPDEIPDRKSTRLNSSHAN